MNGSPVPSDKHDRHEDSPEDRDLKRTKVAHEVTTSREGTHGPSTDGHRSPAPSTSRATFVGSPEKPKSDGGSLAKSVVKKNAKSKKAPDSGSRKIGKRSSSKVRLVGATCLCACVLRAWHELVTLDCARKCSALIELWDFVQRFSIAQDA